MGEPMIYFSLKARRSGSGTFRLIRRLRWVSPWSSRKSSRNRRISSGLLQVLLGEGLNLFQRSLLNALSCYCFRSAGQSRTITAAWDEKLSPRAFNRKRCPSIVAS